MTQKVSYCRLYVILAREAHKAVIFRRGPSRWTRLIMWDTQNDTFEYGEWFNRRIYEDRCDLSPDGSRLLYFANNYSINDINRTYTAISKPPYLTALAQWPLGNTYYGGGLFDDNDTVNINGYIEPHKDHIPPEWFNVKQWVNGKPYSESGLVTERYKRDGWIELQEGYFGSVENQQPQILEKYHPHQPYRIVRKWVEIRFGKSGSSHILEFWLKDRTNKSEVRIDTDRWADWDHQGRLAYVHQGKLFVAHINDLNIQPKMIGDFNAQKPEPIITPDWAKRW